MTVTREEISSAIVRRWPRMTRADVARALAAIDAHVEERGIRLRSVETTSTYVGVWGGVPSRLSPHGFAGIRVHAYIHLGFVALPNQGPNSGWYLVKLSHYDPDVGVGHLPTFEHDRCPDCQAELPLTGLPECGVCGWEAPQ